MSVTGLPADHVHRGCRTMRSETASAWILASLCLLVIGIAVYVFNIPEAGKLAGFLAVMGFIYFGIGAVLTVIHDRHMAKRTRAGRARE